MLFLAGDRKIDRRFLARKSGGQANGHGSTELPKIFTRKLIERAQFQRGVIDFYRSIGLGRVDVTGLRSQILITKPAAIESMGLGRVDRTKL